MMLLFFGEEWNTVFFALLRPPLLVDQLCMMLRSPSDVLGYSRLQDAVGSFTLRFVSRQRGCGLFLTDR
jgi:hypothetical protein